MAMCPIPKYDAVVPKDKPVSPDEITSIRKVIIPDAVYRAFNLLIAENWNQTHAVVKEKEVAGQIVAVYNSQSNVVPITTAEVYRYHWLDVEDIYREAGWLVEYDKPGYNESYPATFKFTKKKTRNADYDVK